MRKILLATLFSVATFVSAMACSFQFSTENDKKNCKAGEEFVVTVKLTLTHRACPVAASETKFKTEGFEVVSATPWKETSTGIWSRQIKVKAMKNKKKFVMTATRTCDKEGGLGTYSLDIVK